MINLISMDVVETPEKSVAPWVGANSLLETAAAERVKAWWERAQRVYPPNTQKAWRCDWASFMAFCGPRGCCPLPATPDTVAAFVAYCRDAGKKPATVRRYLSTIALAHRVAKLMNPCEDEAVQLEIKGLYKAYREDSPENRTFVLFLPCMQESSLGRLRHCCWLPWR